MSKDFFISASNGLGHKLPARDDMAYFLMTGDVSHPAKLREQFVALAYHIRGFRPKILEFIL